MALVNYNNMTNEEFVDWLSKYMIDGFHPRICDEAVKRLKKAVFLPCKPGDVLYTIENCVNHPEKIIVRAIHKFEKYTHITALSRSQGEYVYSMDDFGKYVFLDKEEAEKALKEVNNK